MTKWTTTIKSEGRLDLRKVIYAATPEECERVVRMLNAAPIVGFDTEFVDCNPRNEHPFGKAKCYSMQFSTPEIPFIFVQNWGESYGNHRVFKKFLESDKPKVLHNYKADAHVCANHGIELNGLVGDTMIMDYTYNVPRPHALKECIHDCFGDETKEYAETFRRNMTLKNGGIGKKEYVPSLREVTGDGVKEPLWYRDPGYEKRYVPGTDILVDYAVKDPWYTLRLFEKRKSDLDNIEWCKRGSMWDYYKTFELPYTEVLFRMERRGVKLSEQFLGEIDAAIMDDVVELEREFFKILVGKYGVKTSFLETFNIDSKQQLGKLLIGIGVKFKEFTKRGDPVMDAKTLKSIRTHRKLFDILQERGKLTKLNGTYTGPYRQLMEEYGGRLYTQFKQHGTATTRLSSATPNLQNVPRPDDGDPYKIRRAFIADPMYQLADADLSQIEMRLMAHLTNDEAMIEAIVEGYDLHSVTASKAYAEVRRYLEEQLEAGVAKLDLLKSPDEGGIIGTMFKPRRQSSKNLNFGIGYGMTEYRYAAMTGESTQVGEQVIADFFRGYPGLARGIKETHRFCHKYGYIRTLLGRYIHVPEINSQDFGTMKYGERQSFNFKVQGSAAEYLKMAMILIDRCPKLRDMDVTMNLQVHDELVFRVPRDKKTQARAKSLIEDYMGNPGKHFGMKPLRVPTPASLKFGNNWMEAK